MPATNVTPIVKRAPVGAWLPGAWRFGAVFDLDRLICGQQPDNLRSRAGIAGPERQNDALALRGVVFDAQRLAFAIHRSQIFVGNALGVTCAEQGQDAALYPNADALGINPQVASTLPSESIQRHFQQCREADRPGKPDIERLRHDFRPSSPSALNILQLRRFG